MSFLISLTVCLMRLLGMVKIEHCDWCGELDRCVWDGKGWLCWACENFLELMKEVENESCN